VNDNGRYHSQRLCVASLTAIVWPTLPNSTTIAS
jgi:hypothetical protein